MLVHITFAVIIKNGRRFILFTFTCLFIFNKLLTLVVSESWEYKMEFASDFIYHLLYDF